MKVRGRDVAIDPNILWHRLSLVIKDNTERESCFSYELAQEPTSIFKQGMMRKTQKSQIGIIIKDGIEKINDSPDDSFFVIDGGYLLRKVVWPASVTYGQVCSEYVDYVIRHFGSNSIVVFDGYESLGNNTKFHEQCQRVSTVNAREVIFDLDMEAAANQKKFLAHRSNKSRLISKSKIYFEEKGICIRQAEGDADALIVSTTLDLANEISTPIVLCGNDTDLLVIAIVRAKPSSDIFIMTEINPLKIFKISDLQGKYSERYRELLLPLHFMTGSDTTSAFFNKGKTKAYHMNKQYIEDLRIFTEVNVQKQQIASAGERFVTNLNGGRKNKTIDNVCHDIYNRTIQKSSLSTTFKLESLPPTSAALMHHSSRAYHVVQQALGNTLPAEECGWTRKKGILWPVMTDKEIAPESLLKLISCGLLPKSLSLHMPTIWY